MSDAVTYAVDGGVATIEINRPERRNAIDLPTAQALSDVLDRFDADDDAVVAVLTGSGGSFSAGMDLKALSETGDRPIVPGRGAFGIVERPPAKPLIAVIEGAALGGGLEIALACDLVVAASNAKIGLPEVKRGLVAAAGGVLRIGARIPQNIAMELVLTGAPISASRAAELGLVNHVTEPGQALSRAWEIAAEIAGNAPLAVRTAKTIVVSASRWTDEQGFAEQKPLLDVVRASADAREGMQAFVEKREPQWTGR